MSALGARAPKPGKLRIAAVLGAVLVLAGCTRSVSSYKLPGGPTAGKKVIRITAIFKDVLDLVPQAGVQVDDVTVGTVEKIELNHDDLRAHVTIAVRSTVDLPANATAELRQTSLLGEKFIALGPTPGETPTGRLASGAVIEADHTGRNPEVEEVFTALAALLNGGGLPQLQTIATELSAAVGGREAGVRSVLQRLTTFTGALASRKGEIVRALDNLDRLAATLVRQRQSIIVALDDIAPALRILNEQRGQLVALLGKLSKLGTTTAAVLSTVRADTLADLRLLSPILDTVLEVRGDLTTTVKGLQTLTTLVPRAIPGDFLNLYVTLFADTTTLPVPTGGRRSVPTSGSAAGRLLQGVLQ